MAMLQRIGSVAELYRLEIKIHLIKFLSDSETVLMVRLKRGENKKDTTEPIKGTPGMANIPVACHLKTRVTLYRKGAKHCSKKAKLELLTLSNGKFAKNGFAKLDLASLIHSPLHFQEISLKMSSDEHASLCISLYLNNNPLTSSMKTNTSEKANHIIFQKLEKTKNAISKRLDGPLDLNDSLSKSVIFLHRIPCGDIQMSYSSFYDEDQPITIDSILANRLKTTVNLPPTVIHKVQPNVQAKAVRQDASTGLPIKSEACNGCFLF